MVKSRRVDITPDKSLIQKLGMTGYRTEEALAELIDNSIDARISKKAEQISVKLDFKKKQIIIKDDGHGMNLDDLKDAMTIAKETDTGGPRLGKFGLGMKSACSALGKSFSIKTAKNHSTLEFMATYDENKWLGDKEKDWTNFEIIEAENNTNFHGTIITIDRLNIPLYANMLSKFRKRFGIRYGQYLKDGHITIQVNTKYCEAVEPNLEKGTMQKLNIKLSDGNQITGWIGLLEKRSIKGDYGIHLYRKGRLIKAFDKFGIRHHPEVAKVIGKISLDHVPVNFHKTGFFTEHIEYRYAVAGFVNDPSVRKVIQKSSSQKTDPLEIKSVFAHDSQTVPEKHIDTKMSAVHAESLLRKAGKYTIQRGQLELTLKFENQEAGIYHIDYPDSDSRVITINRSCDSFKVFKNPLFLLGLIRIEDDLVASDPGKYEEFICERNKRWDEFISRSLPAMHKKNRQNDKSEDKIMTLSPRYLLADDLTDIHDHLNEQFGGSFQFTGMSTLVPFLQNAYNRVVYTIHTTKGAGEDILYCISDHTDEFSVLLDPDPLEVQGVLKVSKNGKIIIVRQYAQKLSTTWAAPEKAWLDLYIETKTHKVTLYHDELADILDTLFEFELINTKKLHSLARHKKILDKISVAYLGGVLYDGI